MTVINLKPLIDFLGQFLGGPVSGPQNTIIILLAIIKILVILAHVLGIVPLIIYYERKLIGFVQDRPGPNRVGPAGILQGIADGLKLFMKEDFIPSGADRVLYLLAPSMVTIPALLALCIVPFGPVFQGQELLDIYTFFGLQAYWTPSVEVPLAITNPNIGILWLFAITSVGVYGITLAGWSSENKWSLLGGIRASAQMISYEISLSLSLIGVLLISGLNLYHIIDDQEMIWQWNVLAQPVGFLLFLTAIFAETNRLPFDLAEGEAELTGGFHTEYSSMKFALFFLAEYINMITASAIVATLFFGGYQLVPMSWAAGAIDGVLGFIASTQAGFQYAPTLPLILAKLLAPLGLILKIFIFLTIFIMVRAIWPRLRYDQVMNLGWKVMLVAGLVNLLITAVGIAALIAYATASVGEGATAAQINSAVESTIQNYKWIIGVVTLALLIIVDRAYAARRRKALKKTYRYFSAENRKGTSPALHA